MPNNEPVIIDLSSIRPLINENETQIIYCNYNYLLLFMDVVIIKELMYNLDV